MRLDQRAKGRAAIEGPRLIRAPITVEEILAWRREDAAVHHDKVATAFAAVLRVAIHEKLLGAGGNKLVAFAALFAIF